jgi:sterol desaturase/sphingolipid hydroxylase (fatty acid hydroxylase superfamily)
MEMLQALAQEVHHTFTNWDSRLAFFYMCITVLMVYAIWIMRGRPGRFLTFLLPRETYLHKSNLVDIKIFLCNSLISVLGLFTALSVAPIVTAGLLDAMVSLTGVGASDGAATFGKMALVTLVILLTNDFCTYWVHRIHHETSILWPFHAVHHSAEVMTPLTVTRKHPIYNVFSTAARGVLLGVAQALMLFAFVGQVDVLSIGTVNAAYFVFNALGSNLRHSHVWLSYGPVLEHIFISPAQHHIHHSIERKHYNKNYGEVLAIWDLLFGTLYVPQSYEAISYGLSDENGDRIEQPHPTLRAALVTPFVESWQALWKGTSKDRQMQPETQRGAIQ